MTASGFSALLAPLSQSGVQTLPGENLKSYHNFFNGINKQEILEKLFTQVLKLLLVDIERIQEDTEISIVNLYKKNYKTLTH